MAVLLVVVATPVDIIQILSDFLHLIPAVGTILAFVVNEGVNIASIVVFYIWLKILGVSFANPKRAVRFFGAFGLEFIPLSDFLPWCTLGIIFTIASVWGEELLQKMAGLKVAVSAHEAVGNPNPVSNPSEFNRNPKGFANNLDNLKPNSLSANNALGGQKKSARERNDEQEVAT